MPWAALSAPRLARAAPDARGEGPTLLLVAQLVTSAVRPITPGADNFAGGIGSAAFVAYLSSLCNVAFTGTQSAGFAAAIASFQSMSRPRMMSVGLHCRLAGRPGRALGLARFIDHVLQHDRVWIARRVDIARHWHQHF